MSSIYGEVFKREGEDFDAIGANLKTASISLTERTAITMLSLVSTQDMIDRQILPIDGSIPYVQPYSTLDPANRPDFVAGPIVVEHSGTFLFIDELPNQISPVEIVVAFDGAALDGAVTIRPGTPCIRSFKSYKVLGVRFAKYAEVQTIWNQNTPGYVAFCLRITAGFDMAFGSRPHLNVSLKGASQTLNFGTAGNTFHNPENVVNVHHIGASQLAAQAIIGGHTRNDDALSMGMRSSDGPQLVVGFAAGGFPIDATIVTLAERLTGASDNTHAVDYCTGLVYVDAAVASTAGIREYWLVAHLPDVAPVFAANSYTFSASEHVVLLGAVSEVAIAAGRAAILALDQGGVKIPAAYRLSLIIVGTQVTGAGAVDFYANISRSRIGAAFPA